MKKQDLLTRVLAVIGTALVWFPLLAPVVLSTIRFISDRRFLFDYLMPAELFPSAFVGGGLLIWAALRAHSHRRIIVWSLGAAAGVLILGQALAVVTGLASGATEPNGWPWVLVLLSLGVYVLALVVLGASGAQLLRELLNPPRSLAAST